MADDVTPVVVTGPNYPEAFLSFLRVLATNVATALLPLFMLNGSNAENYPTVRALVIAVIVSLLLTVINFFRPGEVRFGRTEPNVRRANT